MGDNTGFIVRCLNKNRNYNFLPKTEKHAYPMVNAIVCESFILNPRLDAMMKQFHKVSNTLLARDRKQGKSGRNSSMKSLLNLQNYHFLYTCYGRFNIFFPTKKRNECKKIKKNTSFIFMCFCSISTQRQPPIAASLFCTKVNTKSRKNVICSCKR